MNKDFIPYTESFELKELGFNEKCFAYYAKHLNFELEFFENAKAFWCRNSHSRSFSHIFYMKQRLVNCTAPLYQQAFRWIRENYFYDYTIFRDKEDREKFSFTIHIKQENIPNFLSFENFNSFEEAELACLRKLLQKINKEHV